MRKSTQTAGLNICDESKNETETKTVVEARGLPRTKCNGPHGGALHQGVRLTALARVELVYPDRRLGRFAALNGERERQIEEVVDALLRRTLEDGAGLTELNDDLRVGARLIDNLHTSGKKKLQ